MTKDMKFNADARSALMSGAEKVYNAVSTTLGPGGRHVMIENEYEGPTVTKDGVTVASSIKLKDHYENCGAQMIIEGCSNSNDKVGDGSTTATVLAYAIAKEGMKAVSSGAKPLLLKRGIECATNKLVDRIKNFSVEISGNEDIKNVASISANNDEVLGRLVAEAIDKVGRDGTITVVESKSMDTTVKVVEGMKFDNGYLSSYFVTDKQNMTVEYQDAFILVTDRQIGAMKDLIPILEKVAQSGRPLIIIASSVEGEALTTLIVNMMRGAIKCCAVRAPGYGDAMEDQLKDIAILTGATLISDKIGTRLETTTLEHLGQCSSVKITRDDTTLVGGFGKQELITERVDELKSKLDTETSSYEKEALLTRIGKLSGGVAVIEVGAATESEMKEKKFRLDDTISATRAALEEGIIPGGGSTLSYLSILSETSPTTKFPTADENTGYNIVMEAVRLPLKKIAENSGVNGEVVLNEIKRRNSESLKSATELIGFNALTEDYEVLFNSGIIDPAKVTRCALQNAASIANMLLTTECVVVNEENKENN